MQLIFLLGGMKGEGILETIDLSDIQKSCAQGKIIWKDHAAKRMKERDIKTSDVENCIAAGEIIEQYPTDYPAPSCLISGLTANNRMLHVVCSIYMDTLCIITSYSPNLNEWENDYKTRKAVH